MEAISFLITAEGQAQQIQLDIPGQSAKHPKLMEKTAFGERHYVMAAEYLYGILNEFMGYSWDKFGEWVHKITLGGILAKEDLKNHMHQESQVQGQEILAALTRDEGIEYLLNNYGRNMR